MKYRELAKELQRLGWWLLRQGGSHEIWTNGESEIPVPRHNEIKEWTARGIVKKAEGGKNR